MGLQQTRSAADTLESLKDFESDLKSCAADPSVSKVNVSVLRLFSAAPDIYSDP